MNSIRFALAALLLSVQAVAVEPPAAEKIASPQVRTLLGYTRRVLHLPDGHTLAVFSYSNSAEANWLFLIDARDLSSERFAIPNNDIASHSAALASDGNIYIMPYHSGRAYRFDVEAKTFAPIEVKGLPAGEYTWDAIGGGDGHIYFGTYPSACLGRYEIATGKTTVWPQAAANAKYVTDFSVLDDGTVRCRAWGPDQMWLRIDAASAAPAQIPPPLKAPATQQAPVAEPTWVQRSAGATITIGHYGSLMRRDDATGAVTRSKLDNLAPGGNAIMFLEAVTPDCVIGANYSQQHLFRVDPNSGAVQVSDDMIARTTGQPMCAVALDGKAYLGIYVRAIVSVFDPREAFAMGANPREVGEMFTQHRQTRPIGAATDGKLVFITAESDYALAPQGALAVFDPSAGQFETYGNLVEGQNLQAIAYDPASKLVWGGTDRWGQMRSAPPTKDCALVWAFDPAERNVVTTLQPFANADAVQVLGCPRDGVVVASNGAQYVVIDTAARTSAPLQFPTPPPRRIVRGSDGDPYFVAADRMYRWCVADGTFTPVATAPGCTMLTEPSPGLWLLADSTSIYRVRLR